ncbi:MAG: hypothetical protein QME63_09335 [Actinomycetota bacterium]|nr:hypothetical protein [Actinomycetota bacterium]
MRGKRRLDLLILKNPLLAYWSSQIPRNAREANLSMVSLGRPKIGEKKGLITMGYMATKLISSSSAI